MIELKCNGTTRHVLKDGEVAMEGTMREARAEYSRLLAATLKGRSRKRKVFR